MKLSAHINNTYKYCLYLIAGCCALFILWSVASCSGKSTVTAASLNIKYQVLNLSPDVGPLNLYVKLKPVNTTPFRYNANQGYFFLTATDTPFQYRTALLSGITLFTRHDLLDRNLRYSLFIVGSAIDSTLTEIFTIDSAAVPAAGYGKLRFVNASPVETAGLDVYANGTKLFSAITYKGVSKYLPLPAGNYDFYVTTPGSTTKLYDLPTNTVQDGTLYTLYSSGYPAALGDTNAFTTVVLTNR